ncbi:PH domain-containing protein [Lacticaseibacillus zhaodongensis]|uniref:PH domain-containing protein n=1 Tax=Lacticaseibacillus zhaodongensis TaxID=2668065 RepID=UPI0012D3570D|nr:PH domain-containing protein [Lacticaseibacillus zhaodongensis]
MTNSKWHRQNALAIVVLSLHYVWTVAFAGLINLNKDLIRHPVQSLLIGLVVWAGFLLFAVLPQYFTTKYRLTDDEFILRRGIFRRRVLHINYAHIQTVQHDQWFFMKPFAVESLTVETAAHASKDPEVKLIAVPQSLAAELERRQQALRAAAESEPTPVVTESVPLTEVPTPDYSPEAAAKISADSAASLTANTRSSAAAANRAHYTHRLDFAELLEYSLTSLGFVSTILLLISGFAYLGQVPGLEDWLTASLAHLAVYVLVMLGVTLFVGSVIVSVLLTMARYWHFTVTFDGSQVHTTRGLLQTNSVSAPTRRIQAVRFKQNIIRGLLHKGSAQVILASAVGKSDDDDDMVLYPLTLRTGVWAKLHRLVDWLPATEPRLQHFTTGRLAMVRNAVWFPLLVAFGLSYYFRPWGLLGFILPLLAIGSGSFASRARGLAIADKVLFVATGSMFVRHDFAVTRQHIQAVEIKQSWWMQRRQQVTIVVHVRKGNGDEDIKLQYVPEECGRSVYGWYLGGSDNQLSATLSTAD